MRRLLTAIACILWVCAATGILDLDAFVAHADFDGCEGRDDGGGDSPDGAHAHCIQCCAGNHLTVEPVPAPSLCLAPFSVCTPAHAPSPAVAYADVAVRPPRA
jgi:hypothetical protein